MSASQHECDLPDPWPYGGVGAPLLTGWTCTECGRRWTLDIDYAHAADGDEIEVRQWELRPTLEEIEAETYRLRSRQRAGLNPGPRSAAPKVDPWLDPK